MKTYNQFITELNKFELAMKTGKLGLKSLKKIQGKVNKGILPFAHFKIGNTRKVPVDTIQKLRNRPNNPFGQTFTSVKRSAENAMADAVTTGKTSSLTKFRQKTLRGLNKKKVREKDAVAQMRKMADINAGEQDSIRSALKNTGDQNRLLNKFDGINVKSNFSSKADYDRGIRPFRKGSPNFTKKKDTYSKFGGKPTTSNIKKGSIPEPKKKVGL